VGAARAQGHGGRGLEGRQLRLLPRLDRAHGTKRLCRDAHDGGNNAVRARLGLATKYGLPHGPGGRLRDRGPRGRRACALLRERPDALGLAVPGMPVGSPGMDGAVYGGRRDRYDTVLVLRDGTSRVYQKHG
jgi:hypothetical protein